MSEPQENSHHDVSLKTITVPIMNVFLVGAWIVGSTISIVYQFTNLQFTLDKLENQIETLNQKFTDQVSFIQKELDIKDITQWTRRDQEYWCSKTEQQNPNWKCGSFPDVSPNWRSGKLETEAKQR